MSDRRLDSNAQAQAQLRGAGHAQWFIVVSR
jgi:hypothetical protein